MFSIISEMVAREDEGGMMRVFEAFSGMMGVESVSGIMELRGTESASGIVSEAGSGETFGFSRGGS